eukprot:3222775-Amphidinium_carterae.2
MLGAPLTLCEEPLDQEAERAGLHVDGTDKTGEHLIAAGQERAAVVVDEVASQHKACRSPFHDLDGSGVDSAPP